MSSYINFLILLEFAFNGKCFPIPNNDNEITEEWYPEAAVQYPLNSWKTLQVQIVAPNTEATVKTTQSPIVQSPGVAYPLDTGEILQLRIISPSNKEQVDLTDTDTENKTNETTFTEPTESATKKKYIIIKVLDNNYPMDLETKYDKALSIFSRILAMERELHAELFHEHDKLLNSQMKSDLNIDAINHSDAWKELADIFHKIGSDLEHKQDTNLQKRIEGYNTPAEKSFINPGMNEQEENLKDLLETHLSLPIGGLDYKKTGKTEDKLTGQNDASENRYLNTEVYKEGDNLKDLLEKHLSLGLSALGHHENSETLEQITKQSEVIQSSTSVMNRYNKLLEQLLETQLVHGISSALNHKEENEKFSPGSITESSSLKTDGQQLQQDHDVNIRIEAPPPLKISTDTEHRLNLIRDDQISHVSVRDAKLLNSQNGTEKSAVVTVEFLEGSEKYRRFVKKGAEFLLYMWNKLYPNAQNISLEKPSWKSEKFRRFTKRGGDLLIYMWSKLPTKSRAAPEVH